MFKKFDAPSITGVKADEKFSIEGSSAYAKEKVISELAIQQEQEKLRKEAIAEGKSSSKAVNEIAATTSSNKFSPFRS